jgi:glucose-6-phosphate isomerase
VDFDQRIYRDIASGLILDLSDCPALDMAGMDAALEAMAALEGGATANPDEGRMVGHYWLRDPQRAPQPDIAADIQQTIDQICALNAGAHDTLLWIGVGGSGLGPQLIEHCLRGHSTPLKLCFFDNTDPEGYDFILRAIDPARCLVVIVSKSGGTVETRNGMLAAQQRWADAGEDFGKHAIAITVEGSRLWRAAEGWRDRVRLWDWVGGRTSITSAVGGVLMTLCGMDFRALLEGAATMDALTRLPPEDNPAAWLAAVWRTAGKGRGDRALVIEPYVDRYSLLSRYLQQLVMESIGKRLDRDGNTVHQGLTVYGNKGSTDQHAFVQQLRDGRDDTFVHFLDTADAGPNIAGVDGHLIGDHLLGFLCGTRAALAQEKRPCLTIQVPDVSARSLGMLIALFERAVGLYAELININAYHQPGVEAGKIAAKAALVTLRDLEAALGEAPQTAGALAAAIQQPETLCWRLLHHLAESGRAQATLGERPRHDTFRGRD